MSNSEYLILRFDVYAQITKSKNEDKLRKLRWDYAGVYTKFKVDLIDKFCSVKWIDLNDKYFLSDPKTGKITPYSKPWIFGPYDIGLDMLQEETGLLQEHQWMYVYYKIPLKNKEMISFFEEYELPFNVKRVKRI